tara:strand:+ start:2882 stop:3295 length:414 start_codon:yes stop_codon:yes gene_type:complete
MSTKLNILPTKFTNLTYFFPAALTSYLYLKQKYSFLLGYSCPFRHATGVPCPSCFLTRSISASLNGDFQDAFKLHIFGPPVAVLLIIWSIFSLKKRKLRTIKINKKIIFFIFIFLIGYWSSRIFMHFYLGMNVFPIS